MTAILDLPLNIIFNLIKHAIEKEQEKAAWDMWTSLYPYMVMDWLQFKPFDKFKNELIKPNVQHSKKSLEEIEKEMLEIVSKYEKRK